MSDSPLVLKLALRDRISAEESKALEEAVGRIRTFAAGEDIVSEGDRPRDSSLILDGFAGRYKLLDNGRRQITALNVRGDFVDLPSFILKVMESGVVALTECRVALVPHAGLMTITERFPHLTRLLWLNTLLDGAIHRERIVAMGQLQAIGHAAHLLCEMFLRLQAVGETRDMTFDFPLSQASIGEVLGLSTVHVNRIVQELRARNLVSWERREVTIRDWDGLTALAQFDPGYLYLSPEPR